MLTKLFNSQIIVKILGLFFANEDRQFYTQEIIKKIEADAANTHRGLVKLEKLDILKSKKRGNQKYYQLNRENAYSPALKEMFNIYQQNNQGEVWFVMEEMPNYYPQMLYTAINLKTTNDYLTALGLKQKFSKFLCVYENGMCAILFIKKEFEAVGKEMLDKLVSDPGWGEKYNQSAREGVKKFWHQTEELAKINMGRFSDKQLGKIYADFHDKYQKLHILHCVQTYTDLGEGYLSKYLLDYFKNRVDTKKHRLGDIFAVLTTPTEEGNQTKEYKDLIKILDYIIKKPKLKKYFKETETRLIIENLPKLDKTLDNQLTKHVKDYGWIGYGSVGPGWGKPYFIDIFQSLIRQNAKPQALLKKIEEEHQTIIKKQREYIKKFKIDKRHQEIFEAAQGLVYTKGLRKDSMFFSFSIIENLYREIGKRHYLSVNQIRYLYPHELKDLLLKNKQVSAVTLNSRYQYSIYYNHEQSKITLLEGEEAKKFLKQFNIIKENLTDIKTLQGDTATSGRAKGKVKIVNFTEDMKGMQKGNILVSTATSPDLVPALKQAAAIVTDTGGITSHAAIISRELGIPCIVGTKIATKVLQDGDLVDVDATHGKVVIIKKK